MSTDRVNHKDIIRDAAQSDEVTVKGMRKHVKHYLHSLGRAITESDPERDIRVPGIGMIRVRVHKGHKGRTGFAKGESGEVVDIPDHRSIRIDAAPRIDNVLKTPIEKLYDSDEYEV